MHAHNGKTLNGPCYSLLNKKWQRGDRLTLSFVLACAWDATSPLKSFNVPPLELLHKKKTTTNNIDFELSKWFLKQVRFHLHSLSAGLAYIKNLQSLSKIFFIERDQRLKYKLQNCWCNKISQYLDSVPASSFNESRLVWKIRINDKG